MDVRTGQGESAGAQFRLRSQFDDHHAELPRGLDCGAGGAGLYDQRLYGEIRHIELEFLEAIGRIERRSRGARCDRHKSRRHFRAVWQYDRDPIAATDADAVQKTDSFADKPTKLTIGERSAIRRQDCGMAVFPGRHQLLKRRSV
jgi:hypothetical protein